MTLNQRISPSLSERQCNQQASVCLQKGFTLIELMVVLAILGVLAGIASGAWGDYKSKIEVTSAAEKIRTALSSARIKALATGGRQYIGIDYANEKVVSAISDASAAQDIYVVGTGWSSAAPWEELKGVDLKDSKTGGGTPSSNISGIKTFYYKGTMGAAKVAGSGFSIRIDSTNANVDLVNIIVINSVTGRARIKTCTKATADADGC